MASYSQQPDLSKSQAQRAADRLNDFWRAKGYDPDAKAVPQEVTESDARAIGIHPTRRVIYVVWSNMINGVPTRRCVPRVR